MELQPLDDRVVVQRDEAVKETPGGLTLPDSAQKIPQLGTVLSVGQGKLLANGKRAKLSVQKGDRVLFGKYAGTEVGESSDKLLILREEEVLAIVK
jgi:chaperonin GroES